MKCGDCKFFMKDFGSAGLCAVSSEKICASRSCTGLPFRRVFAHEKACSKFVKSD